jgi:hypothetical protein
MEISEISIILKSLETANTYNLCAEVVWSALHYLKENPEAEPVDVISYGLLK